MKKLLILLGLAMLTLSVPVLETGCQHQVTLEQGGAYTSATLATADASILAAASALDGFVTWENTNSAFLAKWPEIHALAVNVAVNENTWIRNAYAARDAYASAEVAYKSALAAGQTGVTPDRAKIDAALALLKNISDQIVAYRAAHPPHFNPVNP